MPAAFCNASTRRSNRTAGSTPPKDFATLRLGTIAWSRVDAAEAHLRGMAVLPQWQGSETGKELLEAAESQAQAAGCTRITLGTTAPLQRAIRFYEKNGYRATGVVGDFFGMPLYQYGKDFTRPAR